MIHSCGAQEPAPWFGFGINYKALNSVPTGSGEEAHRAHTCGTSSNTPPPLKPSIGMWKGRQKETDNMCTFEIKKGGKIAT